jgi:hypothetical protein
MFENRVLRGIFGPKSDEVTGEWKNLIMRSFIICTPHPILFGWIKSRIMRWAGHVVRMGRKEACIGFWWETLKERAQWGDPGVDGKVVLEILGSRMWGMNWFELAQYRKGWPALVNVVMDLRVT